MIHRATTSKGVELIKYFEGFRPAIYNCPGKHYTIGYGHRILKNENFFNNTISMQEAEEILKKDLTISGQAVLKYINVGLNNNQFDALVSFTFNLGAGALQRSSLRHKINYGTLLDASEEFPKWIYANGMRQKGLIRRRHSEKLLFLS